MTASSFDIVEAFDDATFVEDHYELDVTKLSSESIPEQAEGLTGVVSIYFDEKQVTTMAIEMTYTQEVGDFKLTMAYDFDYQPVEITLPQVKMCDHYDNGGYLRNAKDYHFRECSVCRSYYDVAVHDYDGVGNCKGCIARNVRSVTVESNKDHVHMTATYNETLGYCIGGYLKDMKLTSAGEGEGWVKNGTYSCNLADKCDMTVSVSTQSGRLVNFPACYSHSYDVWTVKEGNTSTRYFVYYNVNVQHSWEVYGNPTVIDDYYHYQDWKCSVCEIVENKSVWLCSMPDAEGCRWYVSNPYAEVFIPHTAGVPCDYCDWGKS